jgi:alcohol dehydrogenase
MIGNNIALVKLWRAAILNVAKPNLRLGIKTRRIKQFHMWREKIMRSGRKNDTERHREALKRGIVFSAMGKKVFFNPHVELLIAGGLSQPGESVIIKLSTCNFMKKDGYHMKQFTTYIPTKIHFGAGSLNMLGSDALPGEKALIVISAGGSMKKYGYLDRVTELLKKQGVESVVFDRILANPILSHVMEGAAMARDEGCDFILGLGGGSSIDSAKSIAVMVKNPGDYWDYIHGGSGKGMTVSGPVLPVVAVTTTAGTGTEADPWTVITHQDRNEKIGFGTEQTFPVLSIVDPELMLSIPPHLTAFQGFDAFFHAAEGFIANIASPVSDLYALKSVRLISEFLPRAVADGSNLEARSQVALANTLSGMVESTSSCTSEHSLEHALSAYRPELPHGAGLIMLSRSYFAHFASAAPERLTALAEAMGEDTSSVAEAERPMLMVRALERLQKECGVDGLKMSDYGLREEEIPAYTRNARETMGGLFGMDRVPLSDEDVESIYRKAFR